MRVVLITSIPEELRPFLRLVRRRRTSLDGKPAFVFTGQGYEGLALLAGMGGDAPRRLAEEAMAAFAPDVVLAAGFGGALTAAPPPGGVLVAGEIWRLGPTDNLLRRIDFQPAAPSHDLAALLRAQGLAAHAGALVTTPGVTAKTALPSQAASLPVPVLDMETAEVAAAAHARHLPFLAVRSITDGVGEEIQPFLADIINRHQGVPLSRLVPALWADPRRLGYCFHLWGRSRQAGRSLARALQLILGFLARPQGAD